MSLTVRPLFPGSAPSQYVEVAGVQVPLNYGDPAAEYLALKQSVGLLDLSFRSRVCLLGNDRKRFLHGQVTNNVNDLPVGQGCYAALVTAKGKLQSDLYIYQLADEILLDFEPGLTATVMERLDKYIIADDVQVVDVSEPYGLLAVQGPKAHEALLALGLASSLPASPLHFASIKNDDLGEIYCVNHARGTGQGFDLFVPTANLPTVAERLMAALPALGGRVCGWQALETVRIEAGLPRFGADMDETNLAPEPGIEARAISYTKGCYIGQEVIARIRTYGQVAKALRGLRITSGPLPKKGDKLLAGEKEVGYIASSVHSPALQADIALGYVRREHHAIGTQLAWRGEDRSGTAQIVPLPFVNA
ncbi:MAG: Folate-binding protein YgfZ [Verrucomicrobiales bacterium]|nr:Folate-binding protein YgfZ [Verrucomicrobiales bacterium]